MVFPVARILSSRRITGELVQRCGSFLDRPSRTIGRTGLFLLLFLITTGQAFAQVSVSIAWDASAGATSYVGEWRTVGGSWTTLAAVSSPTATFSAPQASVVEFHVAAVGADGSKSAFSSTYRAVTTGFPVVLNAALEGGRLTGSFTLNFKEQGAALASATAAADSSGVLRWNASRVLPDLSQVQARRAGYLSNSGELALSATATLPTLPAGDVNGDGIVNALDVGSFITGWFTTPNAPPDYTGATVVNIQDFQFLVNNYLRANA